MTIDHKDHPVKVQIICGLSLLGIGYSIRWKGQMLIGYAIQEQDDKKSQAKKLILRKEESRENIQ